MNDQAAKVVRLAAYETAALPGDGHGSLTGDQACILAIPCGAPAPAGIPDLMRWYHES